MKWTLSVCLVVAGLFAVNPVIAEDLLMARSVQAFPETMLGLQQSIREQGYKIARVQRVDIGLTKMGYKTDKYRVVFFGKPDEVKRLSAQYPELIPYLPQKVSLFAENGQTLVITANPATFKLLYPAPELLPVFERWERDMRAILADVRAMN